MRTIKFPTAHLKPGDTFLDDNGDEITVTEMRDDGPLDRKRGDHLVTDFPEFVRLVVED